VRIGIANDGNMSFLISRRDGFQTRPYIEGVGGTACRALFSTSGHDCEAGLVPRERWI
jgi:hypothetical protein